MPPCEGKLSLFSPYHDLCYTCIEYSVNTSFWVFVGFQDELFYKDGVLLLFIFTGEGAKF